jgi:hypothetical protein
MKGPQKVWWLMLIFLLGMVSCAPRSSVETSPLPTASPEGAKGLPQWKVRLTQAGGFAGVSRRVELDSTGALTVSDENAARIITSTLSEKELKEISALVLEARGEESKPAPPGSACRDCFEYTLTIERDGERIQVRADDLTLDQLPLEPLISRLLELQEKALSGK